MSLVVISRVFLLSLCLSILVWTVYLLLLGKLSPKHKRSFKQVNDGMFVFLVSSSIHDCKAPLSFICHHLVVGFTSGRNCPVKTAQNNPITELFTLQRGNLFNFISKNDKMRWVNGKLLYVFAYWCQEGSILHLFILFRDLCDKCCLPQSLISFCGHREVLSVKNVSTSLEFCL